MTTPVQVGYPDWGRYSARATKVYVNAAATASVGLLDNYGPFYVGDVPYLGIAIQSDQPLQTIITTYSDESATVQLGFHSIDVRANGQADIILPVFGAFATAEVLAGIA